MEQRIKKNLHAGRESRGAEDRARTEPAEKFVSNEEKRRMFRNEWVQEALPTPPEIPGFHLCWLATNNQYDPIHKRMRMGYTPVRADEMPGFENYRVKAGEQEGFIACNEMMLYKLPEEVYQDIMAEMHHHAPMDEQEKIKVQQDQLLNAKDSNGKRLGSIEGDGMEFDLSRKTPKFD